MPSRPAAAALAFLFAASSPAAPVDDVPRTDRSTALENDDSGRFTAKVMLDARGPMAFVVDTGSQTSSLSQQAAAQLHLRPGPGARMTGANGSQMSPSVTVADFRSALFARRFEPLLLIPSGVPTDADGVLGMNAFTRGRIEFDFANRQFTYGPSRATPPGYVAQAGAVVHGNFLLVDVTVDGVKARAMIDTGGTRVVGNSKLLDALGLAPGDERLHPDDPLNGMTEQAAPAMRATLAELRLGGVAFQKPSIVFADFSVFGVLGMDEGPALILGVDLLSHLQNLAIDFPRGELQLKP